MKLSHLERLGKMLMDGGFLSLQNWERLRREVKSEKHLKEKILKETTLSAEILQNYENAAILGMEYYDLINNLPTLDYLTLVPEQFSQTHRMVCVQMSSNGLIVATDHRPADAAKAAKDLQKSMVSDVRAGAVKEIAFVYSPPNAIDFALELYHSVLQTGLAETIKQARGAPKMLNAILEEAIRHRSSDIHIEPHERDVVARFRIDGVLQEVLRMDRAVYDELINRIKIEADLRIDEHQLPQDGAIRFSITEGQHIDIRVSITPIIHGEKVVMRILSEYISNLTLENLGFNEQNKKTLREAARSPFGMIITTGPTGSGKSTSLYGLIKMRNSPDVNVATIEDPVEYRLPGINHIQVNQAAGLTFAKGLRSLLRQDPDIILVGEIRDAETATIAVSAALTGHLVFSTLHSNDAATAVPRLLEMGIEPFLLASTLKVVIAQRLARRVCNRCSEEYSVPAVKAKELFRGAGKYFGNKPVSLRRGRGCDACGNSGYRGRMPIHELLVMSRSLEDMVIKRANSSDILRQARKEGMQFMFEDGLEKARRGLITIEELLRVSSPPDFSSI